MIRKLLVLATALLVVSAAPAAAQYTPEVLGLSEDSVQPGGTIEVSCNGLEGGTNYSVLFDGAEVGGGVVPASGTVTGTFTVSDDQAPGTYTLSIVAGDNSCAATLEVLGDAIDGPDSPGFTPGTGTGTTGTGTGAGELARTGASSDVTTYAAVGAGLLAVGGISLMAGRRRRPAHA